MQTTHTHYRTHTCGDLRMEHVGQTVTLAGFLENVREVGQNFAFAVLRDFYGVPQLAPQSLLGQPQLLPLLRDALPNGHIPRLLSPSD